MSILAEKKALEIVPIDGNSLQNWGGENNYLQLQRHTFSEV